jgi:OLD-like protein/AAA domain-containing protein/putative AbiEii toxin of type IV toxin-antitoxin system
VQLQSICADGFLSFGRPVRLELGTGLTVVTGPNGAGKTNLGRCLDLARASVRPTSSDPASERLDLYKDAGYEAADRFTVRLGIDMDQQWERELVLAFARACFTGGPASGVERETRPEVRDEKARQWLKLDSLAPLWSGTLVINYLATTQWPWTVAWEFVHLGKSWHVVLKGADAGELRPGTAEHPEGRYGGSSFADWLQAYGGVPGDVSLDLRTAIEETSDPVNFVVRPLEHLFAAPRNVEQGWKPECFRQLEGALRIDPEKEKIGFEHVISAVLQRAMVVTDNRRLPLSRMFTVDQLRQEANLRDGAAVAAELFRLKNGHQDERARFAEIQNLFRDLTGRELAVRARPLPASDGNEAWVIEPMVTGLHGDRLVELSGAGVQEALVLSTLLRSRPGRVTVLDEPAVNLEPTVQRRLIGRLRGPGQFLVITHSADLVPYEDVADLRSIVRIAPGSSGSEIHQPDFSKLAARDLLQQLRLMEPADVRALLFAAGVILCEGPTEIGALPRWWRHAGSIGLPDPEAANVPLISVDGDNAFGTYLRYLTAFGVPWAVVADGPALRGDSRLAYDLRAVGCWPRTQEPQHRDDFVEWQKFWARAGVFTLADQFGDDGSKQGEFEAFLQRTDQSLFAQAKQIGGRSKPRAGAYFALNAPPPTAVLDLYRQIADRLKLAPRSLP